MTATRETADRPRTVVILGGGVGGVVAANALRKRLADPHRVVLVDRDPDHLFPPSLLWLMTGRRTAARISRPLHRLVRRGVEVVVGEITRIDPETRTIWVTEPPRGDGPLHPRPTGTERALEPADHLVVSLGAELTADPIPGLAEAGHSFYTRDGAESLHRALQDFDGGRIAVLTATPVYKCPAAPYEAAMLIEAHCRRRGLGDRTRIDLYAAEPGPMGVAGPEVSAAVRRMVEGRGIGYHPEHQVATVEPGARRLVFDDGATAEFDLMAYVPPHRAPRIVADAGMVDDGGWIPVDRDNLHTRFPGVYAIGDVTTIPLKTGKPLPKAGVFAERQALAVAATITREITGRGEAAWFDGHGDCFIETGDHKAGFGRGDFYAEPVPRVRLHEPSRRWHLGKILFEKKWLWRWSRHR